MVSIVALPVTAAALVLGPRLLDVVYGPEFADARPVLLIMLIAFPAVPLLSISRSLLVALGLLRFPLLVETAAAVINVSLALALVPGHGAIGAAVANVTAQLLAAVLIVARGLRAVGEVDWRPFSLWRVAAASAGAALAAWLGLAVAAGGPGLALGIAAAVVVFAALAVALKILPRDDAVWLDDVAGTRLGGLVAVVCRYCA
jgi:O-antigen/teichoic acid export membrane protein